VPRPFAKLSTRLTAGVAGLFGVLLIAVVASTTALWTSYRALQHCTEFTRAEREAAAIGVAAREQYIHESYGIITRDEIHLGHDRQWAAELADRVARLRPMVGQREGELLDSVQSNSTRMGDIFVREVFPAVLAGDLRRVRSGHDDVQRLMEATVLASDRTVQHLAAKEEEQASFALRRARMASVTAAVTTLVATFVAIALAIALVRGIVRPLRGLNMAAARIGEGDFDAVAPPTGAAEFEELRGGLERMAAGLRERESRLLKAERLAGLGALAAGVAHELNNPLGVILGYVKTLRSAHVNDEVAADLRIVEEEAHQCRRIVEDLVAFAREPRLERRLTDVAALSREVVTRLGRSGELREGQVVVNAGSVPSAHVDAARLAQVIRNLLLNASAASPADRAIELGVSATVGHLIIRVTDRGTGIAPDDLPHLFEPFFTRRREGTGLGLAVTHGLVMAHGGNIEVHSEEGSGTRVTVTLPLREREPA